MSCPAAEQIVTNTVNNALQADPTLAAGLIRMLFHDCFIEGCDASILLDSTKDNTAEKDSPANLSLRGYEIIDDAKKKIEARCPGVVSCADIMQWLLEMLSFQLMVHIIKYQKEDLMAKDQKIEDTRNLPSPFLNASQLIQTFGQRGFTPQDVVASQHDAHPSKPDLPTPDSSMDSSFVTTLTKTCSAGDNAEQPFDATRNNFDNAYFNALQRKSGVLFSDQTLSNTPATRNIVNGYAFNQAKFFFDFQMAMQKMSNLDVKLGSQGEVRKNCRILNKHMQMYLV
ncbi:Peroxidase 47 [Raphanus sativus]|nr:Peroxidase 47 [Raphanus sativus]